MTEEMASNDLVDSLPPFRIAALPDLMARDCTGRCVVIVESFVWIHLSLYPSYTEMPDLWSLIYVLSNAAQS